MDAHILNQLLELNQLAKEGVPEKRRFLYDELRKERGRPFVGLLGLRGAGKTVMLRQLLLEREKAFYISLDSVEGLSLFEAVKFLYKERGYRLFLLDEIHYCRKWEEELKKIYDFLPVSVFFTSSAALSLQKGRGVLSRRVVLRKVFPFSLREYVFFVKGRLLDRVKGFDRKRAEEVMEYEYLLEEYWHRDLPALLEGDVAKGIAEGVVRKDLAHVEGWSAEEIREVEDMLKFIATSPVEDISYSSISRNVGITKYKARKYVEALHDAFLLSLVEPAGTNVKKEPKVLFVPPFRKVFSKDGVDTGALREELFVMWVRMAGLPLFYVKGKRGEKRPDYLVEVDGKQIVVEIGGRGKGRGQFKGLPSSLERVVLTYPGRLREGYFPLAMVGFWV